MAPTQTPDVPWSGTPSLEIGPLPTARQLKASAMYSLGQLMGIADLNAAALLKQKQKQMLQPPSGAPSGGASGSANTAPSQPHRAGAASNAQSTVAQLRQCAAKRRAEEEADAGAAGPVLPRVGGGGPREVSSVARMRISVVPVAGAPVPPPGVSLGYHLARQAGSGGSGPGAAGGSGSASSLARVYGSRIRVAQLPEDYAECFTGLAPEARPDPNLDLEELGSPGPQRKHRAGRGGVGAEALAAASAAAAGEAPLGSVGVGGGMPPFMLAPQQAAAGGVEVDAGLAVIASGGLLAPFLPQDAALAGLPFGVGAGDGGAGGPGSTMDLMLDAEEEEEEDDGDDDDDGEDADMAQLGDAFDELEAAGGTQGYGAAAFGGAMDGGGVDAGAAEDDGAMVEEF